MISIRIMDGPHAKEESVCFPVAYFTVDSVGGGSHATICLSVWPLGGPMCTPAGARIEVHEYRIAAAALTARPAPRGAWATRAPTPCHWFRRLEDRIYTPTPMDRGATTPGPKRPDMGIG